MFLKTSTARNEFVEPPPQDQSAATLVVNRQRLACRLLEVSLGGFCVMVPRATAWTGEPLARLITHDATYQVKIVKQEARYEGFEVTLQRIEEPPVESLAAPQRWVIYGSRCCAIGLVIAIVFCFVAAPGGATRHPGRFVGLRDVIDYWFESSTPDRPILAFAPPATADDDDSDDLPTITVSLSSTAEKTAVQPPALDRRNLLKQALDAANGHRSRPLNSKTLPWLLPAGSPLGQGLARCRLSPLAEDDLRVFAGGLKSLPARSAADAVKSLREAIGAISHLTPSTIPGFPNIHLVRSEDADVYYRIVDGEVELLRVLPIELDDGTRSRAPSASSGRHGVHR
jgi:hypothetical protein